MRRVIQTNLWGVVYGSRTACAHLRDRGGALINVGSEVSDRPVPLQGIYSASKHAVKGWTDALRTELEYDNVPISVTLIKHGPIDTPYAEHAKNYFPDAPQHVALVLLTGFGDRRDPVCGDNAGARLIVGAAAKVVSTMNQLSPWLTEGFIANTVIPGTHSLRRRDEREDLLQQAATLGSCARASIRTRRCTRLSPPPPLCRSVSA